MEIQVLKQNGSKDSKLTLPDKIFSQSFNADLVHQLLSTYIFNGHQNTKRCMPVSTLGVHSHDFSPTAYTEL